MLTASIEDRSGFASYQEVRDVFREFRGELEWLAYFITGDENVAAACVEDACGFSVPHNQRSKNGFCIGRAMRRFAPR